jgi:meso-butanediol dehydrogenase/(S,S)-butanediol dehydrogenase/diacetyl reductase
MRLKDKVAIITGAGSGIGRATVIKFVSEGAQVAGTDVNAAALKDLAKDFPEVETIPGDVTTRSDTTRIVAETIDRFGKLDILVNSAGITARSLGPEADFEESWDAVIEVNVKGTMLMSYASVDSMKSNGGGSIINLGSIMSLVGYPTTLPFSDGFNPYPVSKGAVVQLTRDMAVQLASEKIRVNAVCPGFVYTALTESVTENPKIHETMCKLHPLGRLGEPAEVANIAAFLASDEASFVTGAAWTVDGGYTAQ